MTRREEIITCAKTLFRDKGYKSVSMRDLAKALDIKASSLYNHISSKEEILAEIVLDVARFFTKEMKYVKSLKGDVKTQLETVIHHHVDLTIRNPEAIAIVNNDWMHLETNHYNEFLNLRNAYEEDLREIISLGIQVKEIKSQNVEVILFSILSTIRTLHSWFRKRQGIDGEELKNDIAEILLNGILTKS